MKHSFFGPAPQTSRFVRRLRLRIICLVAVLAVFWQQHLYHVYRNALAAKYSPTEFKPNVEELQAQTPRPHGEPARFQDDLIANRANWIPLAEGWEGKTFVYQDSVIKTFTPSQSPFRNCAWGMPGETWPTEIPASVRFGGFYQNLGPGPSVYNATENIEGFLPVKAYFRTSEWHLVTPFLTEGSLKKLAAKIFKDKRDHRDIDTQYRPSFNRLLESLEKLHNAGYCHDDIKVENIFVEDDVNWMLGDLGHLRHISHPYHGSLIWRENGQLEDCRTNDVVRLLVSYIHFIQASANDGTFMDGDLSNHNEPLSSLFWWTLTRTSRITALELCERSLAEHPKKQKMTQVVSGIPMTTSPHPRWSLFPPHWGRQYTLDNSMQMKVSENKARWWALVLLFGVPKVQACGI